MRVPNTPSGWITSATTPSRSRAASRAVESHAPSMLASLG